MRYSNEWLKDVLIILAVGIGMLILLAGASKVHDVMTLERKLQSE